MHARRHSLTPITAVVASVTAAVAILLLPAAHAQVATVNGVAIPQARMDLILKMRAANKQPDAPEVRTALRDTLITQEVLSQEAVRKGMLKNPEIAAQIDLQRQETLAGALAQEYLRANPVTDEAVRKEYESQKQKLPNPPKEFRARHILVDKEEEAKDIIAQIKKGGSFEKLAAEKSKDNGSKGRGGDIEWVRPGNIVKSFGEALAKMKKGQLTDAPVQSEFGWHVIRLDDERLIKVPTLEEAKPQLQQLLQAQMVQKMVGELRAKAKID